MASSLFETGGFWYADPNARSPDIQLHLGLGSGIEAGVAAMPQGGVTLNSAYLRPRSRGTVRLASADPLAAPLIDPNYWADPHDREMSIRGLKLAREIMAQVEAGIPVLPVPLISLILIHKAPLRALELTAAFVEVMQAVEPEYLQATPEAWAEAAEAGVLNLMQRKLIVQDGGRYVITEKGKFVLSYYVASLSNISEKLIE